MLNELCVPAGGSSGGSKVGVSEVVIGAMFSLLLSDGVGLFAAAGVSGAVVGLASGWLGVVQLTSKSIPPDKKTTALRYRFIGPTPFM